MAVTIKRAVREPYRHRGIVEGVKFGLKFTSRSTGEVKHDVGLFANRSDFEECLEVCARHKHADWVISADKAFNETGEEDFVQPVL